VKEHKQAKLKKELANLMTIHIASCTFELNLQILLIFLCVLSYLFGKSINVYIFIIHFGVLILMKELSLELN
jgi:hypothetical protein